MKIDITEQERDFLLSTIDAVNIPGKLLEFALEVKKKLKEGVEEAPTATSSEGSVS